MIVPALPAASMVVIDDRPDLHVLLGLRRASSTFVGGLIVYPGGAVDEADNETGPDVISGANAPGLSPEEAAGHLHAALRETREEAGVWIGGSEPIDGTAFPHIGHWTTPEDSHRRYDTHFFLGRFCGEEPVCDDEELVAVWWERPGDALFRLGTGELAAIAPTISFLASLSQYRNVEETFAATCSGTIHRSPWGTTTF